MIVLRTPIATPIVRVQAEGNAANPVGAGADENTDEIKLSEEEEKRADAASSSSKPKMKGGLATRMTPARANTIPTISRADILSLRRILPQIAVDTGARNETSTPSPSWSMLKDTK